MTAESPEFVNQAGHMTARDWNTYHVSLMSQRNRWWLMFALLLPMVITGCGTSRSSSEPLLTDNPRFMDMWTLYTHCTETQDREAMRVDAHILNRSVDVLDFAADPRSGSSVRVSADPAAMAAACALRAGQVAQGEGDLSSAREMYQLIVNHFPQPRYAYYTDQARAGLEQLNVRS
jgi:hypothetical protein